MAASGDFTTYLRGKSQERDGPDEQFMEDGFQRWAESDAPSRVGGAYKEDHDRALPRSRMRRGRGVDVYDSDSDSSSEEEMSGGRRRARKGVRSQKALRRDRSFKSGQDSSGEDDSDSDSDNGSQPLSRSSPGGAGRRRRHRRGSGSDSDSGSDDSYSSDDSREMGKGRRRRRHRRGGESIKEFADQAQSTYNTIKGKVDSYKDGYFVPTAAKDAINRVEGLADKIFGVYDFIKAHVGDIKNAIAKGKTMPVLAPLVPKLDQIAGLITSAGFGKPQLEHHLRRKYGKRSQYSLMKKIMLGGSFLGDKFKEYSPSFKDTGKSAIDAIIDGNPTYKKADTVLQTVNDIYTTLKANSTNIKNTLDKTLPPATANTIKDKMTAVGLGRKGKRAPSKRNMLVSKLMKEHGMSLPEASRKASQMMKGGEL